MHRILHRVDLTLLNKPVIAAGNNNQLVILVSALEGLRQRVVAACIEHENLQRPRLLKIAEHVVNLRKPVKVLLAVESGYRESTESWAAILRDLKRRGLDAPKLVIGDGHLGIWGALAAVFPEAKEQRCWNHRILNVLDKLPLKRQAEARSLLTRVPYAETREEAERQKRTFQAWCTKRGHVDVGRALERDWERMVTFYQFPKEHWKHLRTTNVVESPSVRGGPAAHGGGEALQEGRARDGHHLEDAARGRAELPAPQCARTAGSGCRGRHIRQRSPRQAGQREGCRLIFLYTSIDRTSE